MTQKAVFSEGIFTLRNLRSMGVAAAVEILLALGIATILVWQQMHPVAQPASIVDSTSVLVPQLPQQLPHRRPVPQPQRPQVQPFSEVPSIPTPVPLPTAQPVAAPPTPILQSRSPVVDDFASRMVRAINAQKEYPKGPLLKGVAGQTVVSFDYADGVVSNIQVDKSSGSAELDAAAMQAVQRAALPPKPVELSNLTHFVVILTFDFNEI